MARNPFGTKAARHRAARGLSSKGAQAIQYVLRRWPAFVRYRFDLCPWNRALAGSPSGHPRGLPASTHTLKREIETTLLRYEPRLKSIDITIEETEPGMLLSFTMSCQLHQAGLVRFGTHFTPDGQTRLKLLKAERDSQ
ncbi:MULTISPECIES: hypothetical protein [Cupriavidus]|uniref:hypothetical protein n=1 Tax=Cupriavidus TaxID=106589 RepID=UPI0023E77D24|nr:hypothetical protein [Cupriavidus basilensis]MDF3884330.1 hypothetical protein [Cupriavidus basilensis]